MKCLLILAVVTLGSLAACGQTADIPDGNDLLQFCQADIRFQDNSHYSGVVEEGWQRGMCLGMVSGVASMLTLCPEQMKYGQLVRVVVKYLQDHPEKLQLRDTTLIKQALLAAFPCQAK
jgi:Rap1a immunity proteins